MVRVAMGTTLYIFIDPGFFVDLFSELRRLAAQFPCLTKSSSPPSRPDWSVLGVLLRLHHRGYSFVNIFTPISSL